MDRVPITLAGAPETMLATLYARAIDSGSPRPILGDREAQQAVRRIDYDFRKTGMNRAVAAAIALRAKQLDAWTAEFLADHPRATVLHLACGLDTRVHRLAPPPSVRWLDLDHPEVIELRRRLLPDPTADYRMIGASVTGDGWLEEVPADHPTVAVFEGLTMYLRKADGKRLIQRITGRFASGQLLFDGYGGIGVRFQRLVPAVRNAGAKLSWAIDDPHEIEGWHQGLECLDALRTVDLAGHDRLPAGARAIAQVMARLPGVRDLSRILRYRF